MNKGERDVEVFNKGVCSIKGGESRYVNYLGTHPKGV